MTFNITLLLEIYEEGRWTQKKTPLQVPIFSYTHDYTIKILNFQLFYSVKSHTSIEFCPPDFNSITEIWELSPRLSLSSARKPRKLRNSEFLGCFPLPHVEFFAGARREGNIWNILDPECCGHGTAIIWRVTWALQEFLFFLVKQDRCSQACVENQRLLLFILRKCCRVLPGDGKWKHLL